MKHEIITLQDKQIIGMSREFAFKAGFVSTQSSRLLRTLALSNGMLAQILSHQIISVA